jgi:hypothetical protein
VVADWLAVHQLILDITRIDRTWFLDQGDCFLAIYCNL